MSDPKNKEAQYGYGSLDWQRELCELQERYTLGVGIGPHAARHEIGGGDSLIVEYLTTVETNPALVLSPDGLGGLTFQSFLPGSHASTHELGGIDSIGIENLATLELNPTLLLRPDGVGGVEWVLGGGGSDELVKVSANDTTSGYLLSKLVSSGSLSITEVNDGGDEDVSVDVVFGAAAGTSVEGDDSRVPTQDENDALAGTDGVPSAVNPFVTDSDARNSNARTPTSHAATHASGGGDDIDVTGLAGYPGGGTTFLRDDGTFAATGVGTDELVGVSINDTTPGYLSSKLTAGTAITLVEVNDGGDEDLQISVNLGVTAATAAAGDDSRIPTQDENNALIGTDGTPSTINPFVTDSDSRNTNARTPTAHAASHALGGGDDIDVTGLAGYPGGGTTFLRDDGTFVALSEFIQSVDAGRFQVVGNELRFSDDTESVFRFVLGTTLESAEVTVTEAAGVVSLNLSQLGGGNLTLVFSDGFYTFTAGSVVLTAGTDTNPVENRVYVDQATKLLVATTASDWPDVEMVRVATVVVQSATGVATDGPYKLHQWQDHADSHLQHINEWIRTQPATWLSGCIPSVNITTNAGTPDDVVFTSTDGDVFQLHHQSFPAFSGTPDLFVANDFATPYLKISDLNEALTDALGNSMSGGYFSLVIWGAVSQSGESKLFVNLPTGIYATSAGVLSDPDGYAVFSIPVEFRGVGFLIGEIKLRHQPASGGTWTLVSLVDLRGLFPQTGVGGGGVSTDELVKISSNDTTPGYLLDKITSGTAVTLTEVNDGVDEDLQISVDLGTTAATAAAGNDARIPTQDENDALVGTSGAPSTINPFVTDADVRNTNARTPTAHAASHASGGGDDIDVTGLAGYPGGGTTFLRDDGTFAPAGAGADELVKISINDTTAGYLLSKVTAGTAISLTEINDGGDEDLQISVNLGTSAITAAAGDDSRIPTQDENDALVGTSGAPSAANAYVTDADARNTDARTPTAHASSHNPGGGDALATAAPGAAGLGTTSAEGVAASFARSDHIHQANTAPVDVTKATAAVGTSTQPARADHKHDITTAAPAAAGLGTTSGEGSATTLARSDHTHQANTAPVNVTKATAVIGTSTEPARADHKHDVTTAAPTVGIGASNSEGSATSLARSDHSHALRTTAGGGADLAVGSITDGQMLVRSGTSIIGAAVPGGGSVKELFARVHNASAGEYAQGSFPSFFGAELSCSCWIPADYSSISEAYLIFVSDTVLSSFNIDLNVTYGGSGEDPNSGSNVDTARTISTAVDQFLYHDISDLFTGVAAGDGLGISWVLEDLSTETIYVFGAIIRYNVA